MPEDFEPTGSVALEGGRHMTYALSRSAVGNSFTTLGVRRSATGWTLTVRVHGQEGLLDEAMFELA
jgi:hypothetical protein